MSHTDNYNPLTYNPIPASIEAYNQYGIQPSKLRFMVHNLFYFPEDYKDTLTAYFLRVEDTDIVVDAIEEGMLDWDGTYYQIIYSNTDPTKLLRRKKHTQVKLSFRQVDPVFEIAPTVLIKEIRE